MEYDVIVVGAGLSGLTAASLLAKRGLKVAAIEQTVTPGGSCGVFKRNGVVYDQGAAMLYGFGEKGFNSHRFLFNCLEEPINVIRHELLYTVYYQGKSIPFCSDINKFTAELAKIFPDQTTNISKFYNDMQKMYHNVISENPSYTTPDEIDLKSGLYSLLKHPISYIKFLCYMNMSAKSLLEKYFTNPEIFDIFDKLTSTYCYATVEEAPAIMASIMFVDNHEGGSYYPAGSTLFLPGILEKVVESHNGDMIYGHRVEKIIIEQEKAVGVMLDNGTIFKARDIIYSGTVWNLYETLLNQYDIAKERSWERTLKPTYPSLVLYALVDKVAIPEGTAPIEMIVGNPKQIDETEITAYILSIDDHTLCPPDKHTMVVIGPSFQKWDSNDSNHYQQQKKMETERIINLLARRFPKVPSAISHVELATPLTIERYTLKNGGAVAGPKQMLGQHMFHRQIIKTKWESLYCCGESTTLGTGTPTVTTSGIAAANAVLKRRHKEPYTWKKGMHNYVNIIEKPVTEDWISKCYTENDSAIMKKANVCEFCEEPKCCDKITLDICGIMRRTACGNFFGARKLLNTFDRTLLSEDCLLQYQNACIRNTKDLEPVDIPTILTFLLNK